MTITRKYQVEIEITVDDEDADLLLKTDSLFASGQMQKAATRAALNNITVDGYGGIYRAILARQGITYGKGYVADHADNKIGNNRRHNLRVVTYRQNKITASNRAAIQSMYSGVSWDKVSGKWRAQYAVKRNGKVQRSYIGRFPHEVDAAIAYDNYLLEKGINKPLNFPER